MIFVILYFWILFISYVWFETDGIAEYASLFKLKFFKYEEFRQAQKTSLASSGLSYHNFLLAKHNNFLTRLVTCPTCLLVWFNLIGFLLLRFPIAFLSVSIIATWVGHFGLTWLIKKFNE